MIMRTLLAALCFLVFISIVSSAPSDEQCQSLLQVSSGNIQCIPHGDCTGLTCVNSVTLTNSTFIVDKCQDPVLVNVSVTANDGTTYQRVFNQSTDVTVDNHHFHWNMSRNASYVQVMGILREDNNNNYTLIPYTAVPLNASVCMCQSIQSIPYHGQSPFQEINCVNNSQCTGLKCTFSFFITKYTIESNIQPCSHPPGFTLIIRSGTQEYKHFFDSSTNTTALGNLPLHVVVIHRPYSMIIGIDVVYLNQIYHLVPRTQVILDKTKCTNKPHPSPSSTQTPPTPTSVPGSLATCNAIKRLTTNTLINKCHTNLACDTLDCTTLDYRSLYQILPCSNPPAVHVTLYDTNNSVIFNHTISNSTSVELPLNSKVVITVHHDKPNAIGLEANLKFNATALPIPIIPYTEIPIDRCDCPNVICSTITYPLSPSSTQAPPTTTSAPVSLATCNAIKRLATQLNQCHTNLACDTLDCTTLGYRSLYQILPCSNPPAVHVTMYNTNNNVIFNRTISNSTSVQLPYNSKLVITVHHDKPNAIGLEATLKTTTPTASIPIIPYTEIPIDRCNCPNVICLTTTVSVTPTTASSGSKNVIYAVIGSVVATIIVTLILVFVIMAIVLMIRKCRRSGQFRFQRLTFNVQDDDDDDSYGNKL